MEDSPPHDIHTSEVNVVCSVNHSYSGAHRVKILHFCSCEQEAPEMISALLIIVSVS